MSLTPKEEAIHIEVKALIDFKPSDQESKYIYTKACEEFFDSWTAEILDMLDKHLSNKSKE